jgi:hypothetical protein
MFEEAAEIVTEKTDPSTFVGPEGAGDPIERQERIVPCAQERCADVGGGVERFCFGIGIAANGADGVKESGGPGVGGWRWFRDGREIDAWREQGRIVLFRRGAETVQGK